MIDITHCPFDGGEGRIFESNHFATREICGGVPGPRAPHYRVVCLKCKAFGPSKETKEDAIVSWNERVLFPVSVSD